MWWIRIMLWLVDTYRCGRSLIGGNVYDWLEFVARWLSRSGRWAELIFAV